LLAWVEPAAVVFRVPCGDVHPASRQNGNCHRIGAAQSAQRGSDSGRSRSYPVTSPAGFTDATLEFAIVQFAPEVTSDVVESL